MGFSSHYFKEYNFLLTRVFDEFNDEVLSGIVTSLNQEMEGLENLRELADCRKITHSNLSTQDTTINASHEKNKPGSKLALLIPEHNEMIFGLARAYQMFCDESRKDVQLFHDMNEAIAWLTNDDALENEAITSFIYNT